MRNSVFKRIFLYTGLLVVALLLLMLAGVRFWLEDYYYAQQEEAILQATEQIKMIYNQDPSQMPATLEYFGENLGATMVITNSSGRILYSGSSSFTTTGTGSMGGMMSGSGRFIRSQGINNVGEEDWMFYSSSLADGNLIITRMAYASFERANSVLTGFMLLLTLPLLVVGFLMIFSLSRTITKPLIQLNKVAGRMKDLDFKAKYQGPSNDEIGQLGQTLNQLTVKLEDTIGQLTSELEKEKTMESMRKEFVARVSHEIRTPVSVIRGYVEALEEGVYPEEEQRRSALGVITEESDKITKMTHDLLDLSQLESGNYRLDKRDLEYSGLVGEVYEKFRINKKTNDEFFQLSLPAQKIMVQGDAFRLEQVLNNLINNAFDHVQGDGAVRVSCEIGEDEVITRVFNTGETIPEKDLPYLWESFYKGGETEKGNGVGLGLSIAKNILLLHGGSWGVKNHTDGVEFYFKLPKNP